MRQALLWCISSPSKLTFGKNLNRRRGEYSATNLPPDISIKVRRAEEKSFDELKEEYIKVGDAEHCLILRDSTLGGFL